MSTKIVVLVALAVAASLGCQGQIAPLSAQAGSTVVIPLDGDGVGSDVGYGGTLAEDYQRGTLVYRLDGPTGFELTTRASSAVMQAPNTTSSVSFGAKREIVSVVDIPVNAPVGTHTIHVTRRRIESGVPVDYTGPTYHGELTILPNEIEFEVGGNPFTAVGESTPFEQWGCFPPAPCDWVAANPSGVIPIPEIRLEYDYGEEESSGVAAFEIEVEYPEDVIAIHDVYEIAAFQTNHLAAVWHENDAVNGVLRIGGSTVSPIPVFLLGISFQLSDAEEEILDIGDVTITDSDAWDLDGVALETPIVKQGIY